MSQNRKPAGYWKEETIVAESLAAMEEQQWDTLPGEVILTNAGYYGLVLAIRRHYPGRIRGLRATLGHYNPSVDRGYWTDSSNIEREATKAMTEQEWVKLPCIDLLSKSGYGALAGAIPKSYPGGIRALRKKLGQENSSRPHGTWTQDTIIEEAHHAMHNEEWKTLPGFDALREHGYGALARAIYEHFPGGYRSLRIALGEENPRQKNGSWTIEMILCKASQALELHSWQKLPSVNALAKHGFGDLVNAIRRYYAGGITKLRDDLQREAGILSQKQQLETIIDEYVGDAR